MRTFIITLALVVSGAVAEAQTIGNPGPAVALNQILASSPAGQSFRAPSSSLLNIGFAFVTMNETDVLAPITISLLAGAGPDGPLIASRVITPAAWPFFEIRMSYADFTGTSLTNGATYTAILSTTTTYWGALRSDDAYADGVAFGVGQPLPDLDYIFEVNGAPVVPEPGSGALLAAGVGLLGVAVSRRRKRL